MNKLNQIIVTVLVTLSLQTFAADCPVLSGELTIGASEGSNSCAGTSKADFEGKAWKLVKTGTCTSIEVDVKSADGSMAKRKGALAPIAG